MPQFELNDVLVWLSAGGGAVAIASFVLERVEWFQSLSSNGRRYAFLGIALLLALGSFAVVQYVPQEIIDQIAPWFTIAAGVAVPILTGEVAHAWDKGTESKPQKPL